MILANVAELVDVDQGPIAGYLTISVRSLSTDMLNLCLILAYVQYLFSPFMAVVTTVALLVVDNASKRI